MHDQEISLEEALRIAHEAKDYARARIHKGSTQLENNSLSKEYIDFLLDGVSDMRAAKTEFIDYKKLYDPLEPDEAVSKYETSIETSDKYSLGNCEELAYQAFDYVLNKVTTLIRAEIYSIRKGDHVLLVLNRNQNSIPQDPRTWGDNAVICDPWSNKVFKASEYLTHLKTFGRDWSQSKPENRVFDFNPSIHTLNPHIRNNSNYFRRARTVSKLKANFLLKINHVIEVINNYKDGLMTEVKRLRQKYGDHDQRVSIILAQIEVIESAIQSFREEANSIIVNTKTNDYRLAKNELINSLNGLTKKATNAIQFSTKDIDVIVEHKGKDKKTDLMKFFGVKSTTHAHVKKLTEKTNIALRKKPR